MTDQSAMPAYPCVLEKWETVPGYDGGMTQNYKSEYSGLTKREVFAMAAMQGAIANAELIPAINETAKERGMTAHDGLATFAIEAADALLAALSDQPTRQEDAT